MDSRQLMIIMQNALAHATKIVLHNAQGDRVAVEDVVAVAKQIAKEVVKIGMKQQGE